MLQLVAINEKMAVYIRNKSLPDVELDGFKYLNELLTVRSASGLVEFLRGYPHNLSPEYNPMSLPLVDSTASEAEGPLKFSPETLMKAAESHGIEYFDALVEVDFPPAKASPTWGRKADVCILKVRDIEKLAEGIRELLRMATTSYGLHTCDDAFLFERHVDNPLHIGGRSYNSRLTIEQRFIAGMLPDEQYRFGTAYKLSSGYRDKDDEAPDLVVGESLGERIEFDTVLEKDEAIKEASGIIVSYALTAWLHRFGTAERVVYSRGEGYEHRDAEASQVAKALVQIVRDRRVNICQACGRPFISKKAFTGSVNDKKFCSNSCKVIAKRG